MKNKSLVIIIVIFAVLVGGATVMYNKLAPEIEQESIIENKTESTVNESEGQNQTETQLPIAPDFTVYDIDGNEIKLSDFKGKPVILNFWASWCGPCKGEMPDFEEKYKEYGDEIQFMMINITDGDRETLDSASSFIEQSGYTFPVFYDTNLEASSMYGVYYLPTSIFVDAEGYGVAQATSMINAELLQKGIDMIYNP